MKKHPSLDLVIVALCLVSFARGVYRLGEQSMWWDESLSHYRATKSIPFILSNQIMLKSGADEVRSVDNHPPLYFGLLRPVILVAGDSEFAMRYLSLACGVLIVPLLYQCGKRMLGPRCGALAALLSSLSPLYLWAQQEARPYALLTLLSIATFYALLGALQKLSPPGRAVTPVPADSHSRQADVVATDSHPRIPILLLYIPSVAAMLATQYLSFLLLPAQGIALLLAWSRGRRRIRWALAIVGLIASIVVVLVVRALPHRATVPGYQFIPLGTLVQDVLRSFPLGISGIELDPFYWVGVGTLLAAVAILIARRHHIPWSSTMCVLLSFLLPIAETYVLSFVRPVYMNVRHLIYASPFYFLLLAAGISQARNVRMRVPLSIGAGILVVGMLLSTRTYFVDPRYDKEDHRGWGRYLSEHIRPGDAVVVNPGPISELYLYYVESQAPWIGLPLFYRDFADTAREVERIARQYDRVWVAQSLTAYWANPGNVPVTWLEEHAMRIDFERFYSANVLVQAFAYRLAPPLLDALPDGLTPLALNFDDQLHLLGLGSPMDRVEAGHTLQLSLYWSAATQLDRDYRITLSLTDDAGFSWASADYAPVHGAYPTVQWPADQIVRDDVDVAVAPGIPPGRYRLNASVYPADRSSPALAVRGLESGQLLGLIVPIDEVEVVRPRTPPLDRELSIEHWARRSYGALSLLGHSYGGGAYQPGDVVLLDAYWRAIRPPQRDRAFDLQLVREDGAIQASRTIRPAGDYAPSQWRKGEVVRGQYRFRIPVDVPAGRYTLALAPERERTYGAVWPWTNGRVTLNGLTVNPLGSDRTFEIPPMQHSVGANLGDLVELLGYDLGGTDTIRPGQVVSCTLYWRALQVMNQNYTVFNHLVATDGQTWGQWDNQPQRGTLPTTRWVPGEVIADPYHIPVADDAPAGSLELRVGMYDLQNMARIPAHDERGNVVGDYVTVTKIMITNP